MPLSLAAFRDGQPSAIFVIFITSVWPIIINTAVGIRNIPQDYRNVAAVVQLNPFEFFFKIMTQTLPLQIPSLLPENAPFTPAQRAWLNGFFAGYLGLDSSGVKALSPEENAAVIAGVPTTEKGAAVEEDDGEAPWHDQTMASSRYPRPSWGRPMDGPGAADRGVPAQGQDPAPGSPSYNLGDRLAAWG